MNLPVHSGPAECRSEESILRCPFHYHDTIPLIEQFQYLFEKFQKQQTTPELFELKKIVNLYQQRAERKDLPKNPFRREVEAVFPAIEGSFVPLSFPPFNLIWASRSKNKESISKQVKLKGTKSATKERFIVEFKG